MKRGPFSNPSPTGIRHKAEPKRSGQLDHRPFEIRQIKARHLNLLAREIASALK